MRKDRDRSDGHPDRLLTTGGELHRPDARWAQKPWPRVHQRQDFRSRNISASTCGPKKQGPKKKPPLRTASFLLPTREPPLVWSRRRNGSSSPVVGGSSLSGSFHPGEPGCQVTRSPLPDTALSPSYGHTIKTAPSQESTSRFPDSCESFRLRSARCSLQSASEEAYGRSKPALACGRDGEVQQPKLFHVCPLMQSCDDRCTLTPGRLSCRWCRYPLSAFSRRAEAFLDPADLPAASRGSSAVRFRPCDRPLRTSSRSALLTRSPTPTPVCSKPVRSLLVRRGLCCLPFGWRGWPHAA